MTLDDLENYEAKDSKFLVEDGGYDVHSLFLPSYGAITIEILNILSHFNIDELDQVEWVKMFSDILR